MNYSSLNIVLIEQGGLSLALSLRENIVQLGLQSYAWIDPAGGLAILILSILGMSIRLCGGVLIPGARLPVLLTLGSMRGA
jgi:hypothetical protein